MRKQCFIVGAGMGYPEGLTMQAISILKEADCVIGTARLAQSLQCICPITVCQMGEMVSYVEQASAEKIVLLVSGDSGFFSLTRSLLPRLKQIAEVSVLAGQSSLQYLSAKCGFSYEDAYCMSLHGRIGDVIGAVSYHKNVFVLTGGVYTVQRICQDLTDADLGHVQVYVGENLGSVAERIVSDTAATLVAKQFSELSVVWIVHPQARQMYAPCRDTEFIRGKVPMTKQEVRWSAVHGLEIQPDDIVYDIGAGTGSVSIEMARHAWKGKVYAIERKPEALQLIAENRKKLGAYNVIPIAGMAPQVFAQLPIPDIAFIGGSGGELSEILTWLKQKNPDIRVCVSAIALETLVEAQGQMKQFENVDICQIGVTRGKKVGAYTMMTANNPVFLLTGGGKRG